MELNNERLQKIAESCARDNDEGESYYFCPVCGKTGWSIESIDHVTDCWWGGTINSIPSGDLADGEPTKVVRPASDLSEEEIRKFLSTGEVTS